MDDDTRRAQGARTRREVLADAHVDRAVAATDAVACGPTATGRSSKVATTRPAGSRIVWRTVTSTAVGRSLQTSMVASTDAPVASTLRALHLLPGRGRH